jgi:hypothetical protein
MSHRTQVDPGEGECVQWSDVFQGSTAQRLEKHCNRTHRVLAVDIPRNISFKALDSAIRRTLDLVHDLLLVGSRKKPLLRRQAKPAKLC